MRGRWTLALLMLTITARLLDASWLDWVALWLAALTIVLASLSTTSPDIELLPENLYHACSCGYAGPAQNHELWDDAEHRYAATLKAD